jgi:general secretion pathway protein C
VALSRESRKEPIGRRVLTGLVAMFGREQLVGMTSRALRIVATAWLAWTLAGLAWLAAGRNSADLPPPTQTKRTAPVVDISRLATLNLFGTALVATATGAAANAPDTSLQLKLTGVFVNADAANSSAIVMERSNTVGPAKVYRIKDSLPGGATLAEVYDDRILIKRSDGSSEVLRFEKTSLLDGGSKPPVVAAPINQEAGARGMISTALQDITANPDQFLQKMGLKHSDIGYEVTTGTPESMRAVTGLQAGDKIISVNGRHLGNPQQDQDALAALKNSASAKIEIQRGAQTITLERKF